MKAISISIMISIAALLTIGCGDYSLKTKAVPSTVSAGGKGKIVIMIKTRGKYYLDPEGIYKISFEPPAGIVLDKMNMGASDLGKNGDFTTGFSVSPEMAKGPAQIKANIMFQLCSKELCKFPNEERVISVKIK